jgi:plasmid stabilization system protein ParE
MFEVELSPVAYDELAEAFAYRRRTTNAVSAADWVRRLLAAAQTLRTMPERCGRAAEAETTGRDVRELLFGKKRGTYRIVFTIHPGVVWVRHIRRASRGPVPHGQF